MNCTSGEDQPRHQHPRLPRRREAYHGRPEKIDRARRIVRHLNERHELVIATQAIGELFNVLLKAGLERSDARTIVRRHVDRYEIATVDQVCFEQALDLAADHRLQVWDALILTASARVDCELLLSEDMQDGFTVLGITVANAVATRPHPRLAVLLES